MKKVLLTLVLALACYTNILAESFSIGSNADLYTYRFDNEYFLVVSFKDDSDNRLMEGSVLKILLKDGGIIRLDGTEGSKRTKTRQQNWVLGITTGKTTDTHYAIFYISNEDVNSLKNGVEKIAINTIPERYVYDCGKKFGQNLYDSFMKIKDEFAK